MNVGSWLSKRLNINTCPYCNRHYTFTVVKDMNQSGVRPQFDHFLPKSKYPVTAICFFNLVPACADCNKTKGEEKIKIHPYEDSFDDNEMKFRMRYPYHDENDLVIINGQGHSNIEKLGILKLYHQHIDIVEDIAYKAAAYHWDYYDTLIDSFSGLGLNEADIDRIVWGSALDTAAHEHRPFSKLTRDILEQLGIHSSLRDQKAIDVDTILSLP